MWRLHFASLVTLGVLTGILAGVILAAMVAGGTVDVAAALLLTAVISLVIFLVSPPLTDLMLRWIHGARFLDDNEVRRELPHVHALIHEVAREYRFTAPAIGIIPDRNPTAFTYGLLRSNARLVLTDGLFEFLNEDETRAVVGHELGHIVHRDFLVMTLGGLAVQILYQIYAILIRTRPRGGKKGVSAALLWVVAAFAYLCYQVGVFLLLYLSRTREYFADGFAAERVDAQHLAKALVRIAYGLAEAASAKAPTALLASTRHLGVVDFKSARRLGLAAARDGSQPGVAAEAMLFDIYNPWAAVVQLSSTHPLTGRRIQALAQLARERRQAFGAYDVEAAAERAGVDAALLRRRFWRELAVLALPLVAAAVVAATSFWFLALAAALAAWLVTIFIRFPSGPPTESTVAELMADWTASPVVGRRVLLTGEVIGRVDAGSMFGEDTIFADRTGRMIVDFRSMLGIIGDRWTGWRRVAPHLEHSGEVTGWFRRSIGGFVIMSRLTTTAGTLRARPYVSGAITVLALAGLVTIVVWAAHFAVSA